MLVLSNKKNAECEHCALNLILGNMSTATLETASQIGLRNCFKYMVGGVGCGGERQYICDFGEGGLHAIKHIFYCRKFLLVS